MKMFVMYHLIFWIRQRSFQSSNLKERGYEQFLDIEVLEMCMYTAES